MLRQRAAVVRAVHNGTISSAVVLGLRTELQTKELGRVCIGIQSRKKSHSKNIQVKVMWRGHDDAKKADERRTIGVNVERLSNVGHVENDGLDAVAATLDLGLHARHLVTKRCVGFVSTNVDARHGCCGLIRIVYADIGLCLCV